MRTATLYNFLLEANIMASIAIVLMLAVRKFLRKPLGNRAICFAWMLVAVRLLCPLALPNPAINEIRSPYAMDEAIRPIAGQVKVRVTDALEELSNQSRATGLGNGAVAEGLDDLYYDSYNGMLSIRLMHVYLAGVGVVGAWFVLSNVRFRRRLKADRIEPISGIVREQYEALCAQRGVKPVPVYYVDPLPSACLVGVLRPYIALPLTAKPQEVMQVLTHELCHLKGRDHLWGLVRLLCCAIHWFNPLVWLAARLSRTDVELRCDDRVIRGLDGEARRAYASVLVLAASRRDAPGVAVLATGMTMTGRKLKRRVNAIIHSPKAYKGLSIAFCALACAALVGAFATAEQGVIPDLTTYANTGTGEAVPVTRPIANEQEALAYARELWSGPYLNADMEGAAWEVEALTDPDEYYVRATWPDGVTDTLGITPDGHVRYVSNQRARVDSAAAANSVYDDSTVESMAMYLLEFVEVVSPGTADTIEALTYTGEGYFDGSRFVSFMGPVGPDNSYISFTLQAYPEVRVVLYYNDYRRNNG